MSNYRDYLRVGCFSKSCAIYANPEVVETLLSRPVSLLPLPQIQADLDYALLISDNEGKPINLHSTNTFSFIPVTSEIIKKVFDREGMLSAVEPGSIEEYVKLLEISLRYEEGRFLMEPGENEDLLETKRQEREKYVKKNAEIPTSIVVTIRKLEAFTTHRKLADAYITRLCDPKAGRRYNVG